MRQHTTGGKQLAAFAAGLFLFACFAAPAAAQSSGGTSAAAVSVASAAQTPAGTSADGTSAAEAVPARQAAAGTDAAGNNSRTLRVGFYAMSGFQDVLSDGALSGYGYEYLMRLANYTGWNYTFVTSTGEGNARRALTYEECITMLHAGGIDVLAGVQATDADALGLHLSEYACGSDYGVLTVRADNASLTAADPQTFRGISIGVLSGSVRREEIRTWLARNGAADCTFRSYSTQEAMAAALDSGEVDALYSSSLRSVDGERIVLRMDPDSIYLAMRADDARAAAMDDGMEQMLINEPMLQAELTQKYYSGSTTALVLTPAQKQYVAAHGTVVLGLDPAYEPFEYYDAKAHSYAGITCDVMGHISRMTGLNFSYAETGDYADVLARAKTGEVQAVAAFAHDYAWAEQNGLRLTASYLEVPMSALVRKGVPDYTNRARTAALVRGYYTSQLVQDRLRYNDFVWYDTMAACVQAVNRGEADVTFLPTYSADYFSGTGKYSNVTTVAVSSMSYTLCIAVSKQADPMLLGILNSAVNALSARQIENLVYNNTMLRSEDVSLASLLRRYPMQALSLAGIVVLLLLAILFTMLRARQTRLRTARLHEQRMRLALAQKHTWVWDYDCTHGAVVQSEDGMQRTGLARRITGVPEALLQQGYVHPASAAAFRSLFTRIADGAPSAAEVVRTRILPGCRGDGDWRWERITLSRVEGMDRGSALGVSEDITSEVAAQKALQKAAQYHEVTRADSLASFEADLTANRMLEYHGSGAQEDAAEALETRVSTAAFGLARPAQEDAPQERPVPDGAEPDGRAQESAAQENPPAGDAAPVLPELTARAAAAEMDEERTRAARSEQVPVDVPPAETYDAFMQRMLAGHIAPQDTDVCRALLSRPRLVSCVGRAQQHFSLRLSVSGKGQTEYRLVSVSVYLIVEPVSRHIFCTFVARSATERQRREQELRLQASTDALTGLLNRSAFERGTEQALADAAAAHRSCLLLIIDVDSFKSVNDRYGHQRGDAVLREVAVRMSAQMRADDLVGRLGGDEFVVLMRGLANVHAAWHKAQLLCSELAFVSGDAAVTCSVGVAASPDEGTSFAQLYQSADAALYEAKKAGKHCVGGSDTVRDEPARSVPVNAQTAPAEKRADVPVDAAHPAPAAGAAEGESV